MILSLTSCLGIFLSWSSVFKINIFYEPITESPSLRIIALGIFFHTPLIHPLCALFPTAPQPRDSIAGWWRRHSTERHTLYFIVGRNGLGAMGDGETRVVTSSELAWHFFVFSDASKPNGLGGGCWVLWDPLMTVSGLFCWWACALPELFASCVCESTLINGAITLWRAKGRENLRRRMRGAQVWFSGG